MKRLATLCALLLLFACGENRSEQQLLGRWEGVSIVEEDRPLEVEPKEIRFHFRPDRTYTFESTLNYREAGAFQVRNQYLLTRDTLDPGGQEKTVAIDRLTADTLVLRMMDRDNERMLTLIRVE